MLGLSSNQVRHLIRLHSVEIYIRSCLFRKMLASDSSCHVAGGGCMVNHPMLSVQSQYRVVGYWYNPFRSMPAKVLHSDRLHSVHVGLVRILNRQPKIRDPN